VSVAKAMRARLIATDGVTALVGQRIYPGKAPQDATIPYLVYQRISTTRFSTFSGASLIPESRMQIDIIASSQANAESIASAVRTSLDGYTGTSAGVVVLSSTVEDEADGNETIDGSDSLYYRVVLDCLIQTREN